MSLINKKKEFKIISDVITSKSNIIDIGCSDGSLIEYLKLNNISYNYGNDDPEKINT